MSSLRHCLQKLGIPGHEEAILRGAVEGYKADGEAAQTAAFLAIREQLVELRALRADVATQVKVAGGSLPPIRLDADAAAALTDPIPSGPQIEANNYHRGAFITDSGIESHVETPKGVRRRPEWAPLSDHYGDVTDTVGYDKDKLDIFWKPGTQPEWTGTFYVVNQRLPGKPFNEHKVMGGYASIEEAKRAYLRNYAPGWDGLQSIVALSESAFKSWAYDQGPKGPRGGALTYQEAIRREELTATSVEPAVQSETSPGAATQTDLSDAPAVPGSSAKILDLVHVVMETERTLNVALPSGIIETTDQAASVFAALNTYPRERFQMLGVDKNGKPTAFFDLFAGTITKTNVHPREVWLNLYMAKGVKGVWFAHNHPSGTPAPSEADELITESLRRLLQYNMGVRYLDHLIIADNRYYSMKRGAVGTVLAQSGVPMEVPVMERRVRTSLPPQFNVSIVEPEVARQFFARFQPRESGLVLLTAQHIPMGWWPMTTGQMAGMGLSANVAATLRYVGTKNPAAALAFFPEGQDVKGAAMAVRMAYNFLGQLDVDVLDGFTLQNGQLKSLAEMGVQEERSAYSMAGQRQGASVESVQAALQGIPVYQQQADRVRVIQRIVDAPDHVLEQWRKDGHELNRIDGYFDPIEGQFYLVADNIIPERLEALVTHELVGHFGVDAVLGIENWPVYSQTMLDVYNSRQGSIRAAAANGFLKPYNLDLRHRNHRIVAAREWIARMAEEGAEPTLVQKVWAMLRAALRRLGLVREWTDADLLRLLQRAREELTGRNPLAKGYVEPTATLYEAPPDLLDLFRRRAAEMKVERPRIAILPRVRKLERTGGAELVEGVRDLLADLENRAAEKADGKDRVRGPEWIEERLMRAARTGELSPDGVALARWLIAQNPAVAEDLAISLKGGLSAVSGNYNQAESLITLMKGSANETTAVHEILHHTERMMPREVQEGIKEEWRKELNAMLDASVARGDFELPLHIYDAILGAAGDGDAFKRVTDAIKYGEVPADFYQYVSPSEFWAVNASRIMAERFEASDSWVARAWQWLKEFVQHVQSLLGLPSDSAVLAGLNAVLETDGTYTSPMLFQGTYNTMSAPRSRYQQVYGIRDGRLLGMARQPFTGGVWDVYLATGANETLFNRGQFTRQQAGTITDVSRIFAAAGLELNLEARPDIRVPEQSIFDQDWTPPSVDHAKTDRFWKRRRTNLDQAIILFQNRLLLPRKYEEVITSEVGPLPESAKAHREARLAHPRAAGDIVDFEHDHVDGIVKLMQEHKLGLKRVGTFLYAKTAAEVNAVIEAINPTNLAGSGMTTERAADILAQELTSPKADVLEEIATRVRAIVRFREELLVSKGLAKREVVEMLRARYPNYVPLKEIHTDEHLNSEVSGGFKVGRPFQNRYGRFTEADSELILPAVIAQAKGTIAAGENAEVLRAFLRQVSFAPNPAAWSIQRYVMRPRIDRETGEVRYAPRQIELDREFGPLAISVPVNGERVIVVPTDPRIAQAYKSSGMPVPDWLRMVGIVTRAYALTATALNPEFIVTNALRDAQTAVLRLTGEQNPLLAAKVMRDMLPAMWGAFRGLRQEGQISPEAASWQRWYRRYIEAGGHIAYRGLYSPDEQHKDFLTALADAGVYPEGTGAFSKLKMHRVAKVLGAKASVKLLMDMNGAVENALRLAAFKNAIEAGWNDKNAAMLAREVTVDFNLRGEAGAIGGSLYMFANANIQGTALIFRSIAANRTMRAVAVALMVAAFFFDDWNQERSEEENGRKRYDDISANIFERNIVIMDADGKDAFTIPLSYGFNVFWNFGRLTNAVRRGVKSPVDAAVELVATASNAYSPLGNIPNSWEGAIQYLSPTVTDPFIQAWTNKSFNERPIYPERPSFADPQSDAYTYFQGTPQHWIEIAQWLNKLSGGNDVRSGFVDWHPNMMQHWANSTLGSAGAFVARVAGAIYSKAQGKEVPVRDIPFVRRFMYEPRDFELSHRFYENLNRAEIAWKEVASAFKRGDRTGGRILQQEFREERDAWPKAKQAEKVVAEYRKQMSEVRLSNLSDDRKKAKLEELQQKSRDVMGAFNRDFAKAVK